MVTKSVTKSTDGKQLLGDLKALGRRLEDVGRSLVKTTEKTAKAAAEETLDLAEEAVASAQKHLRKFRAGMKKSAGMKKP